MCVCVCVCVCTESVVDEFMSHLTPSAMRVVITAAGAAGPQPCKERWYGAQYSLEPLPQVCIGTDLTHTHAHRGTVLTEAFTTGNHAGSYVHTHTHTHTHTQKHQ